MGVTHSTCSNICCKHYTVLYRGGHEGVIGMHSKVKRTIFKLPFLTGGT